MIYKKEHVPSTHSALYKAKSKYVLFHVHAFSVVTSLGPGVSAMTI